MHGQTQIKIKFSENPSSVSRVVPCGQKNKQAGRQRDGRDEANSLFSYFYERP